MDLYCYTPKNSFGRAFYARDPRDIESVLLSYQEEYRSQERRIPEWMITPSTIPRVKQGEMLFSFGGVTLGPDGKIPIHRLLVAPDFMISTNIECVPILEELRDHLDDYKRANLYCIEMPDCTFCAFPEDVADGLRQYDLRHLSNLGFIQVQESAANMPAGELRLLPRILEALRRKR